MTPVLEMGWTDAVGLVGIGLIVIAYFLLQTGRITSMQLAYPLLNFIGALLHLFSLIYAWNWASVVIEIFWIAISLYGLWKVFTLKQLRS